MSHHYDNDSRQLPHERLDAFAVSIDLIEAVGRLEVSRGHANIMDQLKRASTSCALNIAEGCGKRGKDRARFFDIARGSALESAAALRILKALRLIRQDNHDEARDYCQRLYAMLTVLARRS